METLKKAKGNARIKKHCNKHKECFQLVLQQRGMAKLKISEFEDRSVETSQSEKQIGKIMGKKKPSKEYLRTMSHLQQV